MRRKIILWAVIMFSFITVVSAQEVSICGVLDLDDTEYSLVDDVGTGDPWGTCFTINGNNVVFDVNVTNATYLFDVTSTDYISNYISFYNNFFESDYVVEGGGHGDIELLNTTRQTGTRIFSTGKEIGGNYWTNPTRTGYSDLCTDSNQDGFCDVAYNAYGSAYDYLAYSDEFRKRKQSYIQIRYAKMRGMTRW